MISVGGAQLWRGLALAIGHTCGRGAQLAATLPEFACVEVPNTIAIRIRYLVIAWLEEVRFLFCMHDDHAEDLVFSPRQ